MILFSGGSPSFLVSSLFLLGLLHQSVALDNLRGNGRELQDCGNRCTNKQVCVEGNCECMKGYFLNTTKGSCEDEDICSLDYPCPVDYPGIESSFCVDYNPPEEYKCGCMSGFAAVLPTDNSSFTEPGIPLEWRPLACFDKDECSEEVPPCHGNATCTNTIGSFNCTCNPDFEGDGITSCVEIPTFEQTTSTDADACNNACVAERNEYCGLKDDGVTYDCFCARGFERASVACLDINECDSPVFPCDENAKCDNIPGNYICTCNDGYLGGGRAPGECTLTPAPSVVMSDAPSGTPEVQNQEVVDPRPAPAPPQPPNCLGDDDNCPGGLACRVGSNVCGACRFDADCDDAIDGEKCLYFADARRKTCTKLEPGDIAFVCIKMEDHSGVDSFAFIALVDIPAGYMIYFTDNRFTSGNLATSEGTFLWTAPAQVSAGSIVELDATSFALESGSFDLNHNLGDNVIAYIGSPANPTFIAAINADRDTFSDEADGSGTDIPTGLTGGVNAVAVGGSSSENAHARYAGHTVIGSKVGLLEAINDQNNWENTGPGGDAYDDGCYKPVYPGYSVIEDGVDMPILGPGDIAFLCLDSKVTQTDNSETGEAFAFLALVDIPAGTKITFTDWGVADETAGGFMPYNEDDPAGGVTFRGETDGAIVFTPPIDIAAGKVTQYRSPGSVDSGDAGFEWRNGNFDLVTNPGGNKDDHIIAYQGTDTNPTFLAAVGVDRYRVAKGSALPPGLTEDASGPPTAVGFKQDNVRYAGTAISGTKDGLLKVINDRANWVGGNANFGSSCPVEQAYEVVASTPDADYMPGDIAFICVKGDNVEEFAFVVLREGGLLGGVSIIITDNGVLSDGTTFRPLEGTLSYTPMADVPQGTIVNWKNGVADPDFMMRSGTFDSTEGGNGQNRGDQLIAYQGTDTDPRFITAITTDSKDNFNDSGATNNFRSDLPDGLSLTSPRSAGAVADGSGQENAWLRLDTNKIGTKVELQDRIYTQGNWDRDSNGNMFECISGSFTVNNQN